MGWETRRGRRYYYRKKRKGGKVVSQYIGQGEFALLAVRLGSLVDQQLQLERAQERRELEKFIQELRRVDQVIDKYHAEVRQVVAMVLEQLGYRKHKGQWRMPREMKKQITQKITLEEYDEFQGLVNAADKETAKPADLEKATQYAQARPGLFDVSNLIAQNVVSSVLNSVNINAIGKVYLEGEAAALRRSLGEATASPLELLLIQQIAICWMRLQLMEQVYSLNFSSGNVSFAKATHLEHRLSSTQKRYLHAVESLARVRRLLARPGVQINVAEQQVVMTT